MAFLAPLFLAGLAAIALPVLLHLRKNRPKKVVQFSSLMFLDTTPPITRRRARLQDVLLLLLRCLGLALLVLAFARPFFPEKKQQAAAVGDPVTHYFLIDNSASMRGPALEQALRAATEALDAIPEKDHVALAAFSDRLRPLLPPASALELRPDERKSTVKALLEKIEPGWTATRLDVSLIAAVSAAGELGDAHAVRIHLFSDFQKGATVESLRNEEWPKGLQVVLHPQRLPAKWTNAAVRVLPSEGEIQQVRVTNAEDSAKSEFKLQWSGSTEERAVSVAPGESAVVDAPLGLASEGTVSLTGDDLAFDNSSAWARPVKPIAIIWTPNAANASDPKEIAYFLHRAMQPTPAYQVKIETALSTSPPDLVVCSGSMDDGSIKATRGFLKSGRNGIFLLDGVESASTLASLLESPAPVAREASVENFALLGEIDFSSNIFAAFADPRYSDFSSVRFWKYRILPPDWISNGSVLARFDAGDPAWIRFGVGEGSLHVLTSTWRPADSQLALSGKFPPLLHGLLSQSPALSTRAISYQVGDSPALNKPGLRQLDGITVAVHLDPAESEITPYDESELRAMGLPLNPSPLSSEVVATNINLSDIEQESRQRLGWWLLVAAATAFLLETLWAGLRGTHASTATT